MSTLQGPPTPHPTDGQGSPSATRVCVWQSHVTAHPEPHQSNKEQRGAQLSRSLENKCV